MVKRAGNCLSDGDDRAANVRVAARVAGLEEDWPRRVGTTLYCSGAAGLGGVGLARCRAHNGGIARWWWCCRW